MKTSLRLLPFLMVIPMLVLLLTPQQSGAQEEEKQAIQIEWHGLIKADYIFDSSKFEKHFKISPTTAEIGIKAMIKDLRIKIVDK